MLSGMVGKGLVCELQTTPQGREGRVGREAGIIQDKAKRSLRARVAAIKPRGDKIRNPSQHDAPSP